MLKIQAVRCPEKSEKSWKQAVLVSVLNDGDKVGKPCWASQTLAIHHLRSIKIIWVCLTVEVQKTDHVPPQMRQPRAQAHGSQPSRAGFCLHAHPSIHKAGLQWLLIQILGVSAFEHQGPAVLWIIRKPDSLHGGSRDLVGELRWWLDGAPPKGLSVLWQPRYVYSMQLTHAS